MVLFCCLVKGLLLLMVLGVAESSSYQCLPTFLYRTCTCTCNCTYTGPVTQPVAWSVH